MPRFREYHFHLPSYRVDSSREIWLLHGVRIISDLLGKSVFFVLPIYIFQLSNTLRWQMMGQQLSTLQITMVLYGGFFMLSRLLVAVSAIPIAQVVAKTGTRFGLLMSQLGLLAMMTGLWLSAMSYWWLILSVLGFSWYVPWFFNSYHPLFVKGMERSKMGEDIGILQFFTQLAAVATPFTTGMLVMQFGYPALFLGAVGLLAIQATLIAKLAQVSLGAAPSWQGFHSWWQRPQFATQAVSFAGRYLNDAIIALWPLYVFLLLGTLSKVGFLYSFSLFLAMMLTLLTGFYVDHRRKTTRPFLLSGGVLAALWLARVNITNFWSVALIDTIDRVTSSVFWLIYDARFFGDGKGKSALAYFAYREVVISITATVFWAGVIGAFLLFGQSLANHWNALFITAAVGVLCSTLVRDHHNDLPQKKVRK